ncbi:unnamed protein product [Schistosoma curassoni]|uniref:DUF3504 domain-containing protein n=1 Tax=Schistosoma curassoni TaxID=6186 RepID=A0A183K530_9TREM|nr:unnamed protein product [Schistosoma curassoni]
MCNIERNRLYLYHCRSFGRCKKSSTYLGNIIDEYGESDTDVKAPIGKGRASIFTTEEYLELYTTVCQPTPRSELSIKMSRQFYCMGQKPGELRKPSSRRYKCLLTVVYAKYFGSVDQTLSATTYCKREQNRSQWRKKSGESAGSG